MTNEQAKKVIEELMRILQEAPNAGDRLHAAEILFQVYEQNRIHGSVPK